MSEKKQTKQHAWVYRAAQHAAAALTHTITPLTTHDTDRIPAEGPVILICNHKTFYDAVAVLAACRHRKIAFMCKKELLKYKPFRWFFMQMGCIPVDRGNTDMAAMRASVKTLREGGVLGIFPEGTRHRKGVMEELEGGTALLAMRANVPVIPAYITPKFRFFRRMHLYVGHPIPFADLREEGINSETCQELNRRITACYAEMVRAHG